MAALLVLAGAVLGATAAGALVGAWLDRLLADPPPCADGSIVVPVGRNVRTPGAFPAAGSARPMRSAAARSDGR